MLIIQYCEVGIGYLACTHRRSANLQLLQHLLGASLSKPLCLAAVQNLDLQQNPPPCQESSLLERIRLIQQPRYKIIKKTIWVIHEADNYKKCIRYLLTPCSPRHFSTYNYALGLSQVILYSLFPWLTAC